VSAGPSTSLVNGWLLEGDGGGREIDWHDIHNWIPEHGAIWIHLDRYADESKRWLREESGLDDVICDVLLAEETRPRATAAHGGLLVVMRGLNQNPGEDPEDMVSVRVWIEEHRIISTRTRPLLAVDDIHKALEEGQGPATTGWFVAMLAEGLLSRVGIFIDDIEDVVGELEDRILDTGRQEFRRILSDSRRKVITVRRYLAPQREALNQLYRETTPLLDEDVRSELRETADRITRYVEDLDAVRDRAAVTHEELISRLSEKLEQRMYVLSVVAVIFLPLGFLAGLLGVNLAGIPMANNPAAFFWFCILLVVVFVIQFIVLKYLKWL
jgi:zinc transporter